MINEKLKLLPKKSGCYLMKNDKGIVIYVGKAKNLSNRVKSYFKSNHTGKTKKLVSEIVDFEYIVTNNELEAFILEINLIKKYDPKYNILLKDDKSYPYIEFTTEKYPRLAIKREININKKKNDLYGPYPNVYAARRLVNLINRLYPLRKCETMPKKECLYFHINECLGYCVKKDIDIKGICNEIKQILSGNDEILINKIKDKISIHSENLNYEQALELKKELDYINVVFEKQKVELNDGINRDVFNYYTDKGYLSIEVFFLRNGKLVEGTNKIIPIIGDINETLEYFIVDFYSKKNIKPKELIVPKELNKELLSRILETKVIDVKKGLKYKIFLMAYENAKINFENEIELIYRNEERNYDANYELGKMLNINNLHVIEAFDNSNLFGTFTVSAMVTFIDGQPSKKDYRKFKMSFEGNDDVACMKEVIYRRYYKVLMNDLRKPDLILLDGAINQINAASQVLKSLNLNIKICGLKKDNHHKICSLVDGDTLKEIEIKKDSNVFFLLSRISEEVHKFTINYHRTIRSKGNLSSVLDNVEGLGEKRKKLLLKKFGSLKKIKEAEYKELKEILPEKVAKTLMIYLESLNKGD